MKRKGRADVARVFGIKWIWNYQARKWIGDSEVGKWSLWYDGSEWKLESPGGTIHTFLRQNRYEAMVQAGYIIASVERCRAGR
jgi:hypothetical protein